MIIFIRREPPAIKQSLIAIMFQNARDCFLSLLVLFVVHLSAVNAMSVAAIRRSELVPSLHSSSRKLSDMRDGRPEGIAFEREHIMLLHHLKVTSPGKRLEDFSEPGLLRVYLDYSDTLSTEMSENFLKFISSTVKSREGSWEIEVTQADGLGNLTLLANVITELPKLSAMRWRYSSIPATILRAIHLNHQNCRLYYELSSWPPPRGSEVHKPDFDALIDGPRRGGVDEIEAIIDSETLFSIGIDLNRYDWSVSYIDLTHRILTTCPDVREVDLNIARPHFNVRQAIPRSNAFDFSNSTKFLPPLEVLTLRKYDLDSSISGNDLIVWETEPDILRWPWSGFPTSVVDSVGYRSIGLLGGLMKGFPVRRKISWDETSEETNLDAWMRLMDWTHIHTLNINQPSNQLQKLAGGFLPNLKNVSFGASRCSLQPALQFLSNVTALNSIAIRDSAYFPPDEAVDIITAYHGSSVQNLRLDRTFLDSTHLTQLLRHCPQLQSLDINMDRSENWDFEVLDTLAAFTELISLTLRFDIRRFDEEDDYWDSTFGYSWDNINYEGHRSELVDEGDELVLLALRDYLAKKKSGRRFERITTMIGTIEVPSAKT